MPSWNARAPKLGEKAPDLQLVDQAGRPLALTSFARRRPLLVLIFGGPAGKLGALI